mgnify:FL=1
MRTWVDAGLEAGALPYLAGEAPWPEVDDLATFDAHLGGVDAVREVAPDVVTALLGGRTWSPEALKRALVAWVDELGAHRIRFPAPAPGELATWCVEHALRHGEPLPPGIDMAGVLVRAEVVGSAALARLDALGLDAGVCRQVLRQVADRAVAAAFPIAPTDAAPSIRAALELAAPSTPTGAEDLADLTALLYGQHRTLRAVDPDRWLARLDALAATPVDAPSLTAALEIRGDHAWLVIDALGLPLLGMLRQAVSALFPGRALRATAFARVGPETTTRRFYDQIAATAHAFEKVDGVDALLHDRPLDFEDLCRLATAELGVALRRIRARLPHDRPLLVFGDHGFRLDPAGRRFVHGGDSTLERVVPLVSLSRVGTGAPAR